MKENEAQEAQEAQEGKLESRRVMTNELRHIL